MECSPVALRAHEPALNVSVLASLMGVSATTLQSLEMPEGLGQKSLFRLAGVPLGGQYILRWPDALRVGIFAVAGSAIRPRFRQHTWRLLTNPMFAMVAELSGNRPLVAAAGTSCGGARGDLLEDIDRLQKGGLVWLVVPVEGRQPRLDIAPDSLSVNINILTVVRALEQRLMSKLADPAFRMKVSWTARAGAVMGTVGTATVNIDEVGEGN